MMDDRLSRNMRFIEGRFMHVKGVWGGIHKRGLFSREGYLSWMEYPSCSDANLYVFLV